MISSIPCSAPLQLTPIKLQVEESRLLEIEAQKCVAESKLREEAAKKEKREAQEKIEAAERLAAEAKRREEEGKMNVWCTCSVD